MQKRMEGFSFEDCQEFSLKTKIQKQTDLRLNFDLETDHYKFKLKN